jgi:hypothetical protein
MFTCLFSGNFEIGQCLSYTDRFTLLFLLSFYRYNPFISLSAFIDIVLVYNYPYESGGCTAKVQWNICEALLMVEAYTKNIVCPSKHIDPLYPFITGMCLKARLTLVERLNTWRQVLTTQISYLFFLFVVNSTRLLFMIICNIRGLPVLHHNKNKNVILVHLQSTCIASTSTLASRFSIYHIIDIITSLG